jgi:magnesium transporter
VADTRFLPRVLAEVYLDQFPLEAQEVLEKAPIGEVVQLLESQTPLRASRILARISSVLAVDVLQRLGPQATRSILSAMDPVQAALLLGNLDKTHREMQLETLDEPVARELRELMTYPEGSAGRLMEPRFPSMPSHLSAGQTLLRLRRFKARDAALVVVTDETGKLLGLVHLADIVQAASTQPLAELVQSPPVFVDALTPREDIIELFSRNRLRLLPVTDIDGHLLGVIRQSSIIQAAQAEAVTDMQAMVGVSRDERALSTPLIAMYKRLPWLNINLLTAFLAASVVGLFEDTIAQFTALAVLLPVVAGQSGNTGAQALAVIMRGLALREIRLRHWQRVLLKEMLAGSLNGLAIAAVTSLGVFLWSQSPGLALVIGVAMVISMALASVAGAAIPLLLTRAGQDPAQSASIILTTVTDIVGFFSFLGLATILSRLL